MGHIRLSIDDIEFVQNDEIVLDDADVILVDERAPIRAVAHHHGHGGRAHVRAMRPFDDAVTRVWSRASYARFG